MRSPKFILSIASGIGETFGTASASYSDSDADAAIATSLPHNW